MKHKGFTLVELLITLSVISIMTGFAWPGFMHIKNLIERDTTAQHWIHFLENARTAAATSQFDVTLCSIEQGKCSDNFDQQWTAFIDLNNDRILDANETILREYSVPTGSRIRLYKSGRNYFKYYSKPDLMYSGPTASLSICPNGRPDQYSLHIKMNIMGRVALEQKTNAQGIPMRKSSSGWQEITC